MYNAVNTRTLGKLFLKLETRSKDGSGRKLILVLFSYLLPGVLLPLLLFKQNADPTGYDYSFLTFLFFSLVIAFSIVSEFDNILISKTEAELFSSLPLDDELIVHAKMYVLWRYVFITTLPLLIPGSVFFYLLMHSVPRALLYFISGQMMCLFLVYTLLLLYSIAMKIFKSTRLSTYTFIFQIMLILFLVLSYQFLSYTFTGRQGLKIGSYMDFINNRDIKDYFPPAWFGFIPARHRFIPDTNYIAKIILPFVIVLMSFISLRMYLIECYSSIREKFVLSKVFYHETNVKSRTLFLSKIFYNILHTIYLRNDKENASFSLMRSLYKRDKTVRLSIFPMIVIPLGLAIFAFITNQLPSPFYGDYFASKAVFHISILLSVLVVLNTGILGIKVTNDTGVSWIYDIFPISPKPRFINGIRKFFVVYMLYPICILLFVLFVFNMDVFQAIVHTLFIFACVNLYNTLFHGIKKDLPFTKDNTLLNSLQRLTSLVFPFLFGVLCIFLQMLVYKNIISAGISVLAIMTLTYWINYIVFHKE